MEHARRKTLRDLYRLPPETRAELIDGEIIMAPAPAGWHQFILGQIFKILERFATRAGGVALMSPYDVVLSNRDVVEPDVVYLPDVTPEAIPKRYQGAPALAVEILSPESRRRDRIVKLNRYAQSGVPEYWIVDPDARTIEVYRLRGGRFAAHAVFGEKERLESPTLKGLAFGVRRAFRR